MNAGAPVVRSVIWAFVETATLVLMSFVTLLVIARLLGPAEFGLAAAVLALIQVLNLFVEALFGEALVQRAELRQAHVDSAAWSALAVAAVMVVMCLLGADAVARLYGSPEMAPLLRVACLGLPFAAYTGVQAALLRRGFGFRRLAMRSLAARVTGTALGLFLAVNGGGPWSIIGQYLVSTALGAAALCYWSPRSVGRDFHLGALRELMRFVVPWITNEALWVNLPRLFQLVAAWLLGIEQFAFLAIGFRISDTLREVVGGVATNVGLPLFARAQHDPAALARYFVTATATLCFIAMPMFASLAICAHSVILAVLATTWLPAVPVLQALAAGAALQIAATFSATMFSAMGRPALSLPVSLFGLVVGMTLLILWGGGSAAAAALAWAALKLLTTGIALALCMRVLPVNLPRLLFAIFGPAMLAAGIGLVLWAADGAMSALPAAARLALLVLTGGLLLGLAIARARPDLTSAALARWRGKAPAVGAPTVAPRGGCRVTGYSHAGVVSDSPAQLASSVRPQ